MAWTTIGNSLIQFAAEWTSTVLTYIRDNLNYLYANTGPVLFVIDFPSWINKPDGGIQTQYDFSQITTQNHIVFDQGDAGPAGETDIFFQKYCYIPAGVSTVRIKAKLRAESENADLGLTFHIGTASTAKRSIATTAGGTAYDIDVDVTGLEDSVQEVKIATYNNMGASKFLLVYYAIGIACDGG